MPKEKDYTKTVIKQWSGPPYSYKVLVDGKWIKMSGFDKEHINNQLHPKKAKKVLLRKSYILPSKFVGQCWTLLNQTTSLSEVE